VAEYLAMGYLYGERDLSKAQPLMEKAIALGGKPLPCHPVHLVNVEVIEIMRVAEIHRLLPRIIEWLSITLALLSSLLKSRAALQLENVALRHQIGVLQRSPKKRLLLNSSERLL
jgi:hypothetical protein